MLLLKFIFIFMIVIYGLRFLGKLTFLGLQKWLQKQFRTPSQPTSSQQSQWQKSSSPKKTKSEQAKVKNDSVQALISCPRCETFFQMSQGYAKGGKMFCSKSCAL